jgi:histidyl-tRNA synthetase
MTALSTQSYKGTRDYYPEEKRIQNYIFSTWKKVVESHGYEEYGAPLLEPLELYTAKSGQELASEQTYAFADRGERTVAIRPEMTPSISRMVAARRQEIGYPARLYSIANFMRYERPQRGREREFWQLNTDIFGVDSIYAEAEIISLAYQSVMAFGAKSDMFVVRINNRKLINYMMSDYLELDGVQSHLMIKLFDRKNKIPAEDFAQQAVDIFGIDNAKKGIDKLNKLIFAKTVSELPAELKESDHVKELQSLFTILKEQGVINAKFDITLMRGLDYYTGTVFEVFDTAPENNRSMFGGGRYDGLVGLFGVDPISTVGMAPGLTPMQLFLESHNLLPSMHSTTDLSLVVLNEDVIDDALKIANYMREEGVNVEVDVTGRKVDKQVKAVVKRQVPFMIFVGEDEVSSEQFTLKETETSKEESLSIERIISTVKDYRHAKRSELDDLFE